MSQKQKCAKLDPLQSSSIEYLFSKNRRLRLQKITKSKMVQMSQKCITSNSYRQQNDENSVQQKKRYHAHSVDYSDKNRYRFSTQMKKRDVNNIRNNLITIDLMKEQIAKSLQNDLVALYNLQKQLISTRSKNSTKIKLLSKNRKKYSIDFNECCSLAQQKYKQLFPNEANTIKEKNDLSLKQQQLSEKLLQPEKRNSIGNSHRLILASIKKRQYLHFHKIQTQSSLPQQKEAALDIKTKRQQPKQILVTKSNCNTQRVKFVAQIEKRRQKQFSPWQIDEKLQVNPEISQIFQCHRRRK